MRLLTRRLLDSRHARLNLRRRSNCPCQFQVHLLPRLDVQWCLLRHNPWGGGFFHAFIESHPISALIDQIPLCSPVSVPVLKGRSLASSSTLLRAMELSQELRPLVLSEACAVIAQRQSGGAVAPRIGLSIARFLGRAPCHRVPKTAAQDPALVKSESAE